MQRRIAATPAWSKQVASICRAFGILNRIVARSLHEICVNAHTILPKDLVEERSIYRQDTFIFLLPERKNAGESTAWLSNRATAGQNEGIRQRYVSGCTIEELSTSMHYRHMLSRKSFIKIMQECRRHSFFYKNRSVRFCLPHPHLFPYNELVKGEQT